MNKYDALEKLKQTKVLSTDLLEPLDVSFERFLRLGQINKERRLRYIEKLIKREECKIRAKLNDMSRRAKD